MTKISKKLRLDLLLVERGLVESRQKAQSLIIAGSVLVNEQPQTKPGISIDSGSEIRLRNTEKSFVSRGGEKLRGALNCFQIQVKGRVALDVGASTGGFTDVLLQAGALKVFAVDVGHNQMDWKIRNDPRVIVKEGVNARYLEFSELGEKVDLIVIDVSFISLTKIVTALTPFSKSETNWITLIKPQFEVGREKVGKGGIVRSEDDRLEAIEEVTRSFEKHGLIRLDLIKSPITGRSGNEEFLAHWKQSNG